ncbi:MAG: tetratricopeptide repeat protein, partial [Fibrobacter sp.]|nr:tetratricopeptide repeat protein [Fibrobacter sp.]
AMNAALKQISLLQKKGASISVSDFLGKVADIIEQYISQKFGFAATGRTLDELKAELLANHADEKTVSDLAAFVEDLDKYRFGGVAFDENRRNTCLQKTKQFLSGLEKGKFTKGTVVRILLPLFFLLIPSLSYSSPSNVSGWFEKANQFYAEEKYDSALVYYKKIQESGVNSSSVLYNLGNSYYRQKKIGLARLYYEKAALINPSDQDIQANIRFVRSNIVDQTPEPERGFLEVLMWNVHVLFPLTTQLWLSLAFLLIISILVSLCFYTGGNLRLWLIYISVMMSLVFAVNGLSTGFKIYQSEKVFHAIVLSPSVDAKNGPDGNKVLFTAHEGTKFRIRKTSDSWSLVSLPNGVSGWVKNDSIGRI